MFYFENISHSTSSVENYFEFISHDTALRTLFILKIPYLVCDLLTAIVLFQMFDNKVQALRCCKVWLFNPITLFAVYIFGRFESIPLLFLALSLLCIQKKRIILAAVCLGLCINGREMMNIYFPIFILSVLVCEYKEVSLVRKLIAVSIVLLFAGIALQVFSMVETVETAAGASAVSVMKEGRVEYLFNYHLHGIIAIVFIYGLTLIWVSCNSQILFERILLGYSLAMFSFFAFSSHTAHFTAWLVIFPAIYIGREQKLLRPFIALCIAWIGYWSFLTDLGVFTTWLAAPFSLYAIEIPNIPKIFIYLSRKVDILNLKLMIDIFKTLFVATLAYLAVEMIRISVGKNGKNQI